MRKIYNYENCRVILNIPDDNHFQERVQIASERFMKRVIFEKERKNVNGNVNTSGNFSKK